jgi:septal ring factor EnvC (AmiA/AmiB activator)
VKSLIAGRAMADAAAAMLQAEVSQLQSTVAYLERWSWRNWLEAQTALEAARAAREEAAAAQRLADEALLRQRQLERSAPGDAPTAPNSPSRARLTGRTGRKRKRDSKPAATGKGA